MNATYFMQTTLEDYVSLITSRLDGFWKDLNINTALAEDALFDYFNGLFELPDHMVFTDNIAKDIKILQTPEEIIEQFSAIGLDCEQMAAYLGLEPEHEEQTAQEILCDMLESWQPNPLEADLGLYKLNEFIQDNSSDFFKLHYDANGQRRLFGYVI